MIVKDEEGTEQPVERRNRPRGMYHGIKARVAASSGAWVDYEVLEGSEGGFFIKMDFPEDVPVGSLLSTELTRESLALNLMGEVVRIETSPRRGVAVRVRGLNPEDTDLYRQLFQL